MRQSDKIQSITYPSFIPETRRPIESPKSIVENGVVNFGTFISTIPNLNILDAKNPIKKFFPKWMNSLRIKEWEAFEISFDEGFMVGAIYDIGLATFNVMIFFDKVSKKVEFNQYIGIGPKKVVVDSLINTKAYNKQGPFQITIENQFQDGKCIINASCLAKKDKLAMAADCVFTSIAQPCVAVMPLGNNRPLYSQKEMFAVTGTISVGDRVFNMNERTVAIVDDHKGMYPFKMHYDWFTGLGATEADGAIGFNLTDNQVIDPINYNENFLWLNGDMHPLPPIKIKQLESGNWLAEDAHDTVCVEFVIENSFTLKIGIDAIGANYVAPFGYHKGWIKDIEGNKHSVDGLFGMGEDKTYHI